MREGITSAFREHLSVLGAVAADERLVDAIAAVAGCIAGSFEGGNRVYLFGCGGSAADAQHIAAEFVNKLKMMRKGLPAAALTTDTSVLTAIGNDVSFDRIFSRQVESFVSAGDVVVGISTSGTSPSVVNGLSAAKELGATTVLLTGSAVTGIPGVTDYTISVPSRETPRVQEAHIVIAHIICELVEESLFAR
ncbi:MAG: SIS domain-containing protein [Methanomicrobiales archaeon]|nr:SIS domain-containing protein [Methanomicrobiales archaeon]